MPLNKRDNTRGFSGTCVIGKVDSWRMEIMVAKLIISISGFHSLYCLTYKKLLNSGFVELSEDGSNMQFQEKVDLLILMS